MCIGLPLQVQSVEAGHAWVTGRGERRRVNTALVGECQPGDWLLVFLDGARERLSPERAAEIDATLDLLGDALAGLQHDTPGLAAFALPSAMSAEQLAALTASAPPTPSTPHKETP
ncbi:hydrogenase assembly chaperone HypC/HupF [Burkholderiales bacterium JOSHI_001]|nr:hydrogenase assembly chaperone HypC/HupF [Burkholderiales bacterium JOSHI_001]